MAKLVSVFISAGHRRLIVAAVWAAAFICILALIGVFAGRQVDLIMRTEAAGAVEQFERLGDSVGNTFEMLRRT